MDNVYEVLDEAKAEIQKLKSENRRNEELSASLKKSQNEQLVKIQEANSRVEKQAQELIEKEGEISVTKQMCEDLNCSLNEKESIIKHLKSANDKLRVDYDGKCKKLVEENKRLVLALEEANEKNGNQEQKIYSFKEEIEGLKGLLAASQKKCSEAEKKMKAAKERREGDHTLLDLEDENRRIEDQLKWKKEQFKHLEEAHEKIREQFKRSEKEWQMEKSTLLNEISSLQTSLDSQTRISEDLQKRLEMCHQALALEESRRKRLEIQLSEFQTRFENAFAEGQDAESEVAGQREEVIATLRSSLGRKEMLCKEMEYQAQKLEQENQELLKSLKDLREAQIHESGSKSSTVKLRSKLKAMEQKYQDCSKNLRTKEAEWSSQLKEVTTDFNDCKAELEGKDRAIEDLKAELESCQSLITGFKLQPENSGQSSKLEKLMKDFNDCKSELEGKDKAIEELKAELEGCYSLITQLKLQPEPEESEKSSQLTKLRKDFNNYRSEVERKDRAIEELKLELESYNSVMTRLKLQNQDCSSQLEDARRNFIECRSELASKDRAVEDLTGELEGCNSLIPQLKSQIQESESQLEKMTNDFNDCRSESEAKDRVVEELSTELEDCHFQQAKLMSDLMNCKSEIESIDRTTEELTMEMVELLLQNEGLSVMLLLLKSGISEAQSKFINEEKKRDLLDRERDEKLKALMMRIKTSDKIQEHQFVMQKELKRYKCMFAEASSSLERANSELVEKICEGNEMEFELQIWKSFAKRLMVNLEENYEMRKELEASLLAQIEIEEIFKQEKNGIALLLDEKNRIIDSLHTQIVSLNEELKIRQTEAATKKANKTIDDLQKQLDLLEQESIRRELEDAVLAQIAAEQTFEHDKQNLIRLLGRNQRIEDLVPLEEKFDGAEINLASDSCEKITSALILTELETEENKLAIIELEDAIHLLHQKLEAKDSEMRKLSAEMKNKMRNSETFIDELKIEKQKLADDITLLLSERENVHCFLGEMDSKIDTLSTKDEQLIETLGKIVDSFGKDPSRVDMEEGVKLSGFEKENVTISTQSSPLGKTIEVTSEGRSPFREILEHCNAN